MLEAMMVGMTRAEEGSVRVASLLPAGVGQSLYSGHLDAVYAANHRFNDPNIWYNEEEMRKQVSQCAGCFILTAQEKPETGRKMREDLFEKACSADGIAGRPPYGTSTRMIELVCWLRFEVNSMFTLAGVTEGNFPSAYRRAVVWEPKARVIDPQIVAGPYADANMDGYFCKNEELKDLRLPAKWSMYSSRAPLTTCFRTAAFKRRLQEAYRSCKTADGGHDAKGLRPACVMSVRSKRLPNSESPAPARQHEPAGKR